MSVLCKKIQKMNIQAYQHPLDLEVEFTLKKKANLDQLIKGIEIE